MANKTVIITGGGQGIGKSMALVFASLGSKVVVCSRTRKDVEGVEKEIQEQGGCCDSHVVDVADTGAVQSFVDAVVKKHGGIDILITSAGVYGPIGSLEENDMDEWKKTIDINLLGTVNVVRCIIPYMKIRKEGKIITMCGGGIGGPSINPYFSAYTTSKAAIAGFTEAMSKELQGYNIQINSISPGAVNTRLLDIVLKAGHRAGKEFLEKSITQKNDGGTPPEKSTSLAVFLASKDSNHITGKMLSAAWDDINELRGDEYALSTTSKFNLRRIDEHMFLEKKNEDDT